MNFEKLVKKIRIKNTHPYLLKLFHTYLDMYFEKKTKNPLILQKILRIPQYTQD